MQAVIFWIVLLYRFGFQIWVIQCPLPLRSIGLGVILQTVPLQHSFALAAVFSGVWDRLCCLSRCHVTLIPRYNPHSACLVSTLHSFLITPTVAGIGFSGYWLCVLDTRPPATTYLPQACFFWLLFCADWAGAYFSVRFRPVFLFR
jgi:hypothetical protein